MPAEGQLWPSDDNDGECDGDDDDGDDASDDGNNGQAKSYTRTKMVMENISVIITTPWYIDIGSCDGELFTWDASFASLTIQPTADPSWVV